MYSARKIKGTDLYHYTLKEKGIVKAVGYCATYTKCPHCRGISFGQTEMSCPVCKNEGVVSREKCNGHPTAVEALAHYHEYLLDRSLYNGKITPPDKCEICNELTDVLVTTGEGLNEMHVLCEKHNNRESLIQVLGKKHV